MSRTQHSYSRQINFEAVFNFRDLGGYQAKGGRTVFWRRLFRSGELRHMTKRDIMKVKEEIGLTSVIDLRNAREGLEQRQEISLMNKIGAKYCYVPLNTNSDRRKDRELSLKFSNMGEVYLYRIGNKEYGQRLVEALEIIADPNNHQLVFHCVAGKDRSGVLAALVLGTLGVTDKDIVDDYISTAPYMKDFLPKLKTASRTPELRIEIPYS